VTYRPVPGCNRYALGSDRSVWFRTRTGAWRRKAVVKHPHQGWAVNLLRDDGTQARRSLFVLMKEVFPEWAGPPSAR
jgi:hypothetical protein